MLKITKNTIPYGIKKLKSQEASAVKESISRAMIIIQAQVLDNTPVKTGRLKGSIGNKVDSTDGLWEIKEKSKKYTGKFGTKVPYAQEVEFGYKSKRRLYFTRGFNEKKKDAMQAIKVRLTEFIKYNK